MNKATILQNPKAVAKLVIEMKRALDRIEDSMIWQIRADKRFRVGQRVQFSQRAIRKELIAKTRTGVRGTIRSIKGPFCVVVQLDDRKQPHTYHHAFLNPVSGRKLF